MKKKKIEEIEVQEAQEVQEIKTPVDDVKPKTRIGRILKDLAILGLSILEAIRIIKGH